MRKRIAVLIAQIDEATQSKFLDGFITEAYAHDYDVCIFTMYQKYQETEKRNIGDSNIYELVNYDLFDAVVLLSDTILTPGFVEPLKQKIHEKFSGPVIVVDDDSEYFESIIMDHYSPFRKIVDHMIEVHGYKNIAFLGGKKGHPHSVQRYNAFLDSMNAHDLRINPDWIYHGNYWYDSAEDFAKILLANKDNLPEALICANDYMAIGTASYLSEHGIRIPEDIAISGYDSIEAGRFSPKPLTSAHIPARECGVYCLNWVNAKLNNQEIGPFISDSPIYLGGSCGCECDIEFVTKTVREQWRTQQSSKSMFSDFNHMLEDLMSQNRISNFLQMLLNYTYQIRPFYTFDICFNNVFLSPDAFEGEKAIRNGYDKIMNRVIHSTETDNSYSLTEQFETKNLIPELTAERDYPTTFIFNPLYSDDRCFGYTVLNYGRKVEFYDQSFRIWMRDIMSGMEAFYRQRYMRALFEKIQSSQIRDALTGLYNYSGFLRIAEQELLSDDTNSKINIAAIDIKGIHQINEIYGREIGERAIKAVAHQIQFSTSENDYSCRMANDEFLIAFYDSENAERYNQIISKIENELQKVDLVPGTDFKLQIHHMNLLGKPESVSDLEYLINQATSIKNHKKANAKSNKGAQNSQADVMDEVKCNQIVTDILNRNLFTYHYQPIVNANDGSIFAYEALMRCEAAKVTPLQILKSAKYLDRLSDVEKYTLLNVTHDVQDNIDSFGEAKVFINSLPGVSLKEDDEKEFAARLMNNDGRFVIEFTEESELDDAQLSSLKSKFDSYGCSIAVDDYGAGFSNANNLLRYMPQYVKIDRMLISKIQSNPQKQHLVRGIVEFAHDNGILALAEGVETAEELSECLKIGVDLIQGYYTGRPQREPLQNIAPEIIEQIRNFRLSNFDWPPLSV